MWPTLHPLFQAETVLWTREERAELNQLLIVPDRINAERRQAGEPTIDYGIGLNIGRVMYGNIGVPERLAFSAIGPTVIEVARIEKLTKNLPSRVLTTGNVAHLNPQLWRSVGFHHLDGLARPQELFGFVEQAAAAEAA